LEGFFNFSNKIKQLKRIIINTISESSEILIGEEWTNVPKYLPVKDVVIITDENVYQIYKKDFPDFPVIALTPGEESKSLEVIESMAKRLLDLGIDRSGFVLAIGGGVVCDVAGFLASIYMRGIRFGFISSTLLSQVDASVGGKNAVNLRSVKNILGTFRQPEFVICDPNMLKTLPEVEYLSGVAELIKNGVIMDKALVNEIEQNGNLILDRNIDILNALITRSVELKALVVREDEKESGLRMILNFGHTFGHVIETQAIQKHGFAVASGMIIATDISVKEGLLPIDERDRIFNLLNRFNLIMKYNISSDKFEKLIAQDKKKSGDTITFILLQSIGKAIVRKYNVKQLLQLYRSLNY
jgi:3-dehydroquinate synthase